MKLTRLTFIVFSLVLISGSVYLLFYAAHRKDIKENETEQADLSLIKPEVIQFHQQLIIADLHSDNLLWDRDPLERINYGHVDIPRLIEGNFSLQVFDAVIKVPRGQNYFETKESWDQITLLAIGNRWPVRTWISLAARALYQSEILHRAEAQSEGRLEIMRT
jgi:hypothetical protein